MVREAPKQTRQADNRLDRASISFGPENWKRNILTAMEAVHFSTVASRHFSTTSHSVSTNRGFYDSKYGARSSTAKLGSSWTASRTPAWLTSRNLFTVSSKPQKGFAFFSVWFPRKRRKRI